MLRSATMTPDSKWLDALTLPLRATLGATVASGALLLLESLGVLDLDTIAAVVRPIVILIFVIFAALSVVSIVDLLMEPTRARQRESKLAARREVRRREAEEQRAEHEALVLSRLDTLSDKEIHYVANCLRDGSPTFFTYAYTPPLATLTSKGLVWSPVGTFNQDRFPFSFHDFVWAALQDRKDEFIKKDDTHKKAERVRNAAKRQRRGY